MPNILFGIRDYIYIVRMKTTPPSIKEKTQLFNVGSQYLHNWLHWWIKLELHRKFSSLWYWYTISMCKSLKWTWISSLLDLNTSQNIQVPDLHMRYGDLDDFIEWQLIMQYLTLLHLDKMAANLDAFSWMKSFVFWVKCHWSLFLRVQLTIVQRWFR